jgi:hypothetical protein
VIAWGLAVVARLRVVVVVRVVTRGAALVRLDVVVVRRVVAAGILPIVVALVLMGSLVVLSPSEVVNCPVVLSKTVVVASAGGSGGGLRRRTNTNVSRIAARKIATKMAVRLSFLFFRWASPPFQIISLFRLNS